MIVRVAVIGSRNFCDYFFFAEKLEQIISNLEGDIEFISGGCLNSADELIQRYCKEHNCTLTEYLPDWDLHKKAAGIIRNKLIVNECTHLIAYWNGVSKGTKNSIDMARKQNKPIRIIQI